MNFDMEVPLLKSLTLDNNSVTLLRACFTGSFERRFNCGFRLEL